MGNSLKEICHKNVTFLAQCVLEEQINYSKQCPNGKDKAQSGLIPSEHSLASHARYQNDITEKKALLYFGYLGT